jgi:hypothetical protein
MSKLEDLNYYNDWLKRLIAEEHIKFYKYSGFKNIQQIGRGSHGSVNRANWRKDDRFFALKSLTLKEVVKEVLYIILIHYSDE